MHVGSILHAKEMLDDMMVEEMRKSALEETLYSQVIKEVDSGWRQKGKKYRGELQRYWTQKDNLSVQKGILMRNDRFVIPGERREKMIERTYRGHQGADKCIKRAKESMWWSDMQRGIKCFVEECNG